VKQVFEQIAQAEKAGATPEERKKLEEQAAEKASTVVIVLPKALLVSMLTFP
jgi:hypothetical protein